MSSNSSNNQQPSQAATAERLSNRDIERAAEGCRHELRKSLMLIHGREAWANRSDLDQLVFKTIDDLKARMMDMQYSSGNHYLCSTCDGTGLILADGSVHCARCEGKGFRLHIPPCQGDSHAG